MQESPQLQLISHIKCASFILQAHDQCSHQSRQNETSVIYRIAHGLCSSILFIGRTRCQRVHEHNFLHQDSLYFVPLSSVRTSRQSTFPKAPLTILTENLTRLTKSYAVASHLLLRCFTNPTKHISLAGSLQSYQITRRYSQFVELHAQIIDVTGMVPPKPLPPKTYLRGPDIEERRVGLETYLQAILEHEALRSSVAIKQFLEVPLPKHTRPTRDFYELVRDIRSDLQLARRYLQSHNPDSYIQVKKALSSAEKTFAEITELEKDANISDAEMRRRKDVCDEMHRESLSLMTLAQNYRHSAVAGTRSTHFSSETLGSESPFAPKAGTGAAGGGRRLGASKETTTTLGQSNEELLQSQTQIIEQQDDLLSSLLPVLKRQKELGNMIGQELDEQSDLLDQVGDSMDTLESKLKMGGKQITKITGKR